MTSEIHMYIRYGAAITLLGVNELQVDFGGWKYPMNVLVAESLKTESILGLDF